MKVNKKCVQSMCNIGMLLFILVLGNSCTRTNPEQTQLLLEDYPRLYDAVFDRDSEGILVSTSSEDSLLSNQAWKAMISTTVDDLNALLEKVIVANANDAWAALWFKELNEEHILHLHSLWNSNMELRKGIASVLGYHGNRESLSILLNDDTADLKTREEIALAVGRISLREDLTPEEEIKIIEKAISTTKGEITERYLYGLYRGRKGLSFPARDTLSIRLTNFYPDSPIAQQYIARIFMNIDVDQALFRFELDQYETMDVQLAIEIAQGLSRYPLTKHGAVVLNALLDHLNPNVKIEALKAIQRKSDELGSRFDNIILNKIGLIRGVEPALRLEALNSISNPETYRELVFELSSEVPYLSQVKYSLLKKILSNDEVIEQFQIDLESDNRLNKVFTIRELSNWWGSLEDDNKTEELTTNVKSIVSDNLITNNRSVVYELSSLMRDEKLITDSEYYLIENLLTQFKLPEDIEVYQVITAVIKQRFEVKGEVLIDSLAKKGNSALNKSLMDQGWDIIQNDVPSTKFRTPDWKDLTHLGPNPILIIDTNKGDFEIQFDVLSAPATISGIQQLIDEKSYKWVPFHRVIPNFVVQGGDVESQDGYGGPNYVVPTEASSVQYHRGIVGIASAGTDTEGSQFFIMNQWRPHLTGLYTIIGAVIDGMDVVDRIVQGDYIEDIYWDRSHAFDQLFE